jgi:hypothetical protein
MVHMSATCDPVNTQAEAYIRYLARPRPFEWKLCAKEDLFRFFPDLQGEGLELSSNNQQKLVPTPPARLQHLVSVELAQ